MKRNKNVVSLPSRKSEREAMLLRVEKVKDELPKHWRDIVRSLRPEYDSRAGDARMSNVLCGSVADPVLTELIEQIVYEYSKTGIV